jgi:hypothetical protein
MGQVSNGPGQFGQTSSVVSNKISYYESLQEPTLLHIFTVAFRFVPMLILLKLCFSPCIRFQPKLFTTHVMLLSLLY